MTQKRSTSSRVRRLTWRIQDGNLSFSSLQPVVPQPKKVEPLANAKARLPFRQMTVRNRIGRLSLILVKRLFAGSSPDGSVLTRIGLDGLFPSR